VEELSDPIVADDYAYTIYTKVLYISTVGNQLGFFISQILNREALNILPNCMKNALHKLVLTEKKLSDFDETYVDMANSISSSQ
jgi:hypothetical protein